MKTKKLTEEQKNQMSYTDVAFLVLTENEKKMKIQDLFTKVIKLMELPDSYFESKIGDFFGLLSTDKRFTMLEKGFWDLRINHSAKIVIEDEEDEDEELFDEEEMDEEIISEDDEENEEINYDDDRVDDDDEEDDLKDLVIMDDTDESEM